MRVFVDTNVLVHARDRTDEEKQRRALAWVASLWEHRAGRLSWQVLQEYYVTLTRMARVHAELWAEIGRAPRLRSRAAPASSRAGAVTAGEPTTPSR